MLKINDIKEVREENEGIDTLFECAIKIKNKLEEIKDDRLKGSITLAISMFLIVVNGYDLESAAAIMIEKAQNGDIDAIIEECLRG